MDVIAFNMLFIFLFIQWKSVALHSLSCVLRRLLELIAAVLSSAVQKDIRPITGIQRKIITIKKLLKDFFFFFVFLFIKLIKRSDHDPAETENVPFIKLFGPDYSLLCKLAPHTEDAEHSIPILHRCNRKLKVPSSTKPEQLPCLCPWRTRQRAAAAAEWCWDQQSWAQVAALGTHARVNVRAPQQRVENSLLSTFLPLFFCKQN